MILSSDSETEFVEFVEHSPANSVFINEPFVLEILRVVTGRKALFLYFDCITPHFNSENCRQRAALYKEVRSSIVGMQDHSNPVTEQCLAPLKQFAAPTFVIVEDEILVDRVRLLKCRNLSEAFVFKGFSVFRWNPT